MQVLLVSLAPVEALLPAPDSTPISMEQAEDFMQYALRELGPEDRVPVRSDKPDVGRNDPCPCASGRKYKRCCGVS